MENDKEFEQVRRVPSLAWWAWLGAFCCFPALVGFQMWLWRYFNAMELVRNFARSRPLLFFLATALFALCAMVVLVRLCLKDSRLGARLSGFLLAARKPLLAGLIVVVLGFYIARYATGSPFLIYASDGTVNQDTLALAFQAKVFAAGKLWVPDAGPCFDTIFVVLRNGRQFGKYQPVTPLVFALSQVLFKDLRPFAVALPFCSALLAGLLAAEIFGGAAGVLAAALWLVSGDTLIHGASVRSDPVATFLLLLVAWAALRFVRTGGKGWLALVGLALLLQVNNKAFAGLIAAAGLGAYALVLLRARPKAAKLLLVTLGAGMAVGLALMLGVNKLYTGSPFTSMYEVYTPFDKPGLGLRECYKNVPPVNFTLREVPRSAIAPFGALSRAFTPLGPLVLLAGLPLLWRKRKAETALVCAATLSLLIYGAYWFSACLIVQLVIAPPVYLALCTFKPNAKPEELRIIREALSQPTLVFLSPRTATFGIGWDVSQLATVERLIGMPNLGLGALTPDPFYKSSLLVAVDRGAEENAKAIARFPGYRILRATYEGDKVKIEPYEP